jgi:hypothetical protein
MSEMTNRAIASFVNWLAARARHEDLPSPRTSTRVMERIRGSSQESGTAEESSATTKADFQSILAAHLKRRG